MRYAIIGDIHSNLIAFEAVLQDLEKRGGFNKIWCLGDVVGYGPDPHACIELLKHFDHVCIAGNHDLAAVGLIDILDFNEDAARANLWTADQLTENDKEYLKSLAYKYIEGDFSLFHGSPREPVWEYLLSTSLAKANFKHFDTSFCLVGHSHVPLVFAQSNSNIVSRKLEDNTTTELGEHRLIINPGSVGQPRNLDPRASYALYDNDVRIIHHYLVEYNIEATQQKMREANLPEFLIERLSQGM